MINRKKPTSSRKKKQSQKPPLKKLIITIATQGRRRRAACLPGPQAGGKRKGWKGKGAEAISMGPAPHRTESPRPSPATRAGRSATLRRQLRRKAGCHVEGDDGDGSSGRSAQRHLCWQVGPASTFSSSKKSSCCPPPHSYQIFSRSLSSVESRPGFLVQAQTVNLNEYAI